ncbi:hypothetical protein EX461_16365 [Vibrio parahaemolyticus]|nr:hypothetical protein [Vibrio parahaemolyticus]
MLLYIAYSFAYRIYLFDLFRLIICCNFLGVVLICSEIERAESLNCSYKNTGSRAHE